MRWDRSVGGAIGRGLQGSYALLGATAALAGIFRSAISLVVLVVEVRATGSGRSASRGRSAAAATFRHTLLCAQRCTH